MDKRRYVILGTGLVALMAVFSPAVLRAATGASDTAEGGVPSEPSTPFSRAIEAGKKVSSQALSTKTKVVSGEAVPAATVAPEITGKMGGAKVSSDVPSDKKGKYVFEYPASPVITEEMSPVKKTIEGEVSIVIKAGMSVEFGRDGKNKTAQGASDLWIEFSKGTKLEGVKAYNEFQNGDRVKVSYIEAKDGSKRAIESITLLKHKTEEERKREAEADAREEAAYAKKHAAAAKSSEGEES